MILKFLGLLLAIPLGFILSTLTKDEKNIYSKNPYFPVILWVLAILSAVFFTIDVNMGNTLLFVFITILVWNNTDKLVVIFNKRR